MKSELPEGIEIDFSESLTSEQRKLVEQSIATMIARTRAEADAARARLTEERALFEAINAPVAKLTLADREAAKALEKLSSGSSQRRMICGQGMVLWERAIT